MSLTSYATLITAVGDWLERSDAATLVPDWIALTEAEMNKALRVNDMITRATITVNADFETVPTDYLAPRSARLVASPYTLLKFVSPEQMAELKVALVSGTLRWYALVGGSFEFAPAPSTNTDITLTYFAKIPALAVSNTSNWVLASHPEAYLRGCLKQAGLYYRDNDLVTSNAQLFEAALESIRLASRENLAFNLTPSASAFVV